MVNTFKKQVNHISKTHNRFTETKKEHKYNTRENQTTKGLTKTERTKKKYKINGKRRFQMEINTYLSIIKHQWTKCSNQKIRVVDWK